MVFKVNNTVKTSAKNRNRCSDEMHFKDTWEIVIWAGTAPLGSR